jgi:hypothetical protein
MATRYTSTFYSEKGRKYYLVIDDVNFSGVSSTVDIINSQITWQSDVENGLERYAPIIASNFKFTILINDNVKEQFLTDFLVSPEGRFTIRLTGYDISNSPNFYWYGYVLADLVEYDDVALSVGYFYDINAIDGIGWLKGIDYKPEGYDFYQGDDTIINHVNNCLQKITYVPSIYGTNVGVLASAFNWHEDSWTYSSTIDPLIRMRINHKVFYTIDTKDNITYMKCYDVLKRMMIPLGMRFFFSDRKFFMVQPNSYLNSAVLINIYYLTSTLLQQSSFETSIVNDNSDAETKLIRLASGRWGYYGHIKDLDIEYEHIASVNLLAGKVFNNLATEFFASKDLDYNNNEATITFTSVMKYRDSQVGVSPIAEHIVEGAFVIELRPIAVNLIDFLTANRPPEINTWTLGTNWFFSDDNGDALGYANAINATGNLVYTNFTPVSGQTYYVSFGIEVEAGSLRVRLGGDSYNITVSGEYYERLVCISTEQLTFDPNTSFRGKINYVKVNHVKYWLKREVSYNGFQHTFTAQTWEQTFNYYKFVIPGGSTTLPANGGSVDNIIVNWTSPQMPESGDLGVRFMLTRVQTANNTDLLTSYLKFYELGNLFMEHLAAGNLNGQNDVVVFGSFNNDTSSISVKKRVFIGDGPSLGSPGAIRVKNDSNAWQITDGTGWRVGNTGTGKNINQLLVNEIIKGQLFPVKKMVSMSFQMLDLNEPWYPHKAIEVDGLTYVMESASLDLLTDIVSGTFVQIIDQS